MMLGVDNVCNQCIIVCNAADSRCRLKGVNMSQFINSSKIQWSVMHGGDDEGFLTAYCADGEGLVQVVDYGTHVALEDQCAVCKTWDNINTLEDLLPILEVAQNYLAATYNEIFQDFRIDA